MHMSPLTRGMVCAVATSQYSGAELKKALRRDIDDLARTKALQVQSMDYSCIVFDTAPTGHTLRLLQFPTTLQKGLQKLMSLKGAFGGIMSQVAGLMGMGNANEVQDQLLGKLETLKVGTGMRSRHGSW